MGVLSAVIQAGKGACTKQESMFKSVTPGGKPGACDEQAPN